MTNFAASFVHGVRGCLRVSPAHWPHLAGFVPSHCSKAGAVKALAQIEMLFAYATTVFVFREAITRGEAAGCALVAVGVVLLVLL